MDARIDRPFVLDPLLGEWLRRPLDEHCAPGAPTESPAGVTTRVTTSTPSISSNVSNEPHDLPNLDAGQSIYSARTWLRALWTEWSVEVRVFSGAWRKAPQRQRGAFLVLEASAPSFGSWTPLSLPRLHGWSTSRPAVENCSGRSSTGAEALRTPSVARLAGRDRHPRVGGEARLVHTAENGHPTPRAAVAHRPRARISGAEARGMTPRRPRASRNPARGLPVRARRMRLGRCEHEARPVRSRA